MGIITKEYLYHFIHRYHIKAFPCIFVETGTFKGDAIFSVLALFRTIHTFELSRELHKAAEVRFKWQSHVNCHFGNSVKGLEELLPLVCEPIVFWLDAHYSGPGTAIGEEEVPLLRELEIIGRRKYKDIIIIDDIVCFGKKDKWGGDEKYAPFIFDWSNVTVRSIRKALNWKLNNIILQQAGADKLVILTNLGVSEIICLFLIDIKNKFIAINVKTKEKA